MPVKARSSVNPMTEREISLWSSVEPYLCSHFFTKLKTAQKPATWRHTRRTVSIHAKTSAESSRAGESTRACSMGNTRASAYNTRGHTAVTSFGGCGSGLGVELGCTHRIKHRKCPRRKLERALVRLEEGVVVVRALVLRRHCLLGHLGHKVESVERAVDGRGQERRRAEHDDAHRARREAQVVQPDNCRGDSGQHLSHTLSPQERWPFPPEPREPHKGKDGRERDTEAAGEDTCARECTLRRPFRPALPCCCADAVGTLRLELHASWQRLPFLSTSSSAGRSVRGLSAGEGTPCGTQLEAPPCVWGIEWEEREKERGERGQRHARRSGECGA
eukprot:scaffold9553_cov33-Tisochrysis_lutea.AAC.4